MSYMKTASTTYLRLEHRSAWLPGAFNHVPLKGFAALIGSLLAYVAAIAVLVVSNGQLTAQWSIQPAVYLTIAYTLSNILIRIALKEGADVLWWTRAMARNTTISDLHHTWETGNSAFAALKKPTFGLVTLASLAVSLTAVNGPFLQRATRTRLHSSVTNVIVAVPIVAALPAGWYTGFVGGRSYQVSILTSQFTTIVQDFTLGRDILVEPTGCIGICTTFIPGAGFSVQCDSNNGSFFNLSNQFFPNGSANMDMNIYTNIFSSAVTYNLAEEQNVTAPGYIQVAFKDTTDCKGTMKTTNCTLKPATVHFPLTITQNKTGSGLDAVALTPGTTIFDDVLHSVNPTWDDFYHAQAHGVYYALATSYTSVASIAWKGAIGFQLTSSGSMVNRYAKVTDQASCSTAFSDPTPEILSAAREIMFRIAIDAANASLPIRAEAQQVATQQVYHSDYIWLGVASVFTALGFLLTLPMFHGYWKLGRKTSMSPIELAKAFAAPMLAGLDSNANVDTIMKILGDREVRYGASSGIDGSESVSLEMENPRLVRRPEHGEVFGN